MADTTYARSYVAAPLTIQSQVVGFIHGDRYFHRGETTNFDRDVISAFAEGLSLAIERSTMKARLENLRAGLRQLAGEPSDNSGTTHPFESASALSRITPIASTSTTASSAEELEERLTRRELEIVRYLANGETNARIAARLVLSEDTVKTHVKHILRKLGASNRAEAVSKWLLASTVRR
jgi:DNA-binding NarL/FixJ family response regulator